MSTILYRFFYRALIALVLTGVAPGVRAATSITPADLATGLMIESQGDNLGVLGYMFGPDPSSSLSFLTNVGSSGTTFSFSLNSGAVYQGQDITLMGSGEFDPHTGMLVTSSAGTLGSQSWTTSGSETVIASGNSFSSSVDLDVSAANPLSRNFTPPSGRHRDETFNPDGTSTNSGWYTNNRGEKIFGTDFNSTNKRNPDGTWQYKEGASFAEGFSPVNGGAGSSTASIVPEPSISLLFLGGLSMLGLIFARRGFFGTGEGTGIRFS